MFTEQEKQEVDEIIENVAFPIVEGTIRLLPRVKREEIDDVRDSVAELAIDACAHLLPADWSNDHCQFKQFEELVYNHSTNCALDSMMGRELPARRVSVA